ncbi:MAG: IS3 family transposase [Ruminococcus sp.]|nr:IS3 family transposase [Ruminococcus sp.]
MSIIPHCLTKGEYFISALDELLLQLSDYIDWFNYSRIHGSLGYLGQHNDQ